MLASKNHFKQAHFFLGFWYQEGMYVKKDIQKAVLYYKEASSFNNQYAKNNLGIIYKHGYNEIEARAGNAIVYFEEAIRKKNDYLSMYNLAHIYMYDKTIKQDLNKSIELLIRSMNDFRHSLILLCLALLKKYDLSIERIKQELKQRTDINRSSMEILFKIIYKYMSYFDVYYESYRYKDYLYNVELEPVKSSKLKRTNKKDFQPKYPKAKELSSEFYKGFGEDLYTFN
ncbi:hypothetical protein M9Y10_003377 [Tritrichomonas musculus]|uniref:Beta-lactamase n=1 Tax=Tritrichomonas musculus TaxID=1915356 RepID=A0ABR2JPP0_9EUKA